MEFTELLTNVLQGIISLVYLVGWLLVELVKFIALMANNRPVVKGVR